MTSHPYARDQRRQLGGTISPPKRRSSRQFARIAGAALEILLNAIEANDPVTGMHVRRVAAYSLVIADAIGMDAHQRHAVERVALFHDIGKLHEALFDIVHDRTRLTAAERRAIVTHPARGAQVLAPLKAFYPELPAGVLAHHERWDGTGYPRRLRGARIPIEARIVAIADTFDAVAHSRRYRKKNSTAAAFNVIAQGRGTQFDPALVDFVLFPPIQEMIVQKDLVDRKQRRPRAPHGSRRRSAAKNVPDVSFRWRSESLGSTRVSATNDIG